MSQHAMTPAAFEQALRAKGACYHIHHPFHVAMYEGRRQPRADPGLRPTASTTRCASR